VWEGSLWYGDEKIEVLWEDLWFTMRFA